MTFYFHNSYQQSPVGFQLSKLDLGSNQLEKIGEGDIMPEEFRSLMVNGGVACAIGTVGDIHYLVFHNLHFADAGSRQWYVTLGVTAGQESKKQFAEMIRKLFLDYSGFMSALQDWFHETPDQPLSYAIDASLLQKWLNMPVPNIGTLPFYQAYNPVVNQYRTMLAELEKGTGRRLFLLVPESTVAYFFVQNKVFSKELPHFLFNAEEFDKLLCADTALLNEKKKEEQTKAAPIWEQLGITREQFIQYVITGTIICASFIGMISHFLKRVSKHH